MYAANEVAESARKWTMLVYRMPPQPAKHRLQVWRRLQAMGVQYLQEGVCVLPGRPELDENMGYIAMDIQTFGGTFHLFGCHRMVPGEDSTVIAGFRKLADGRYEEILSRLGEIEAKLENAADLPDLVAAEDGLRRERVAFLRARRLAYFGGELEAETEARLDALRLSLDDLGRWRK